MTHKAFLLILDGWGIGQKPSADAILQANTPYFDSLWAQEQDAARSPGPCQNLWQDGSFHRPSERWRCPLAY